MVEREVYCDRLFLLLCWFLGVRYTDALSALCKMKMTTKMKTRKLRWHKLTVQLTTSLLLLPILCKVNRNPSTPPPGNQVCGFPPSPFPHLPPLATPKSNDTGHYPPSHPISGTPSDRYLQRTGNGMEWSGLNADTLLRRHVGHEPPPSAHHWTLTDSLVCPADFPPVRWMRRWFCVVICERVGEGFNRSSG